MVEELVGIGLQIRLDERNAIPHYHFLSKYLYWSVDMCFIDVIEQFLAWFVQRNVYSLAYIMVQERPVPKVSTMATRSNGNSIIDGN